MTTPSQPGINAPEDQWLVYADALQEAGDPRGELIALNKKVAGGADPAERDALVREHATALLGAAGAHVAAYELGWHGSTCVLEQATIRVGPGDDPAVLVGALLDTAAAAELRAITLMGVAASDGDQVDLAPGVGRLVAGMPQSCTAVSLVDERAGRSQSLVSRDYDPMENLVQLGSLAEICALPHLEQLRIVTADPYQTSFLDLEAPGLRAFSLHGLRFALAYDAPSELATQLASIKWPKLEELELTLAETWTASVPNEDGCYVSAYSDIEDADYLEEYGEDDGWNEGVPWSQELAGILGNVKQTPLRRLALTSFDSGAQLLEALVEHGLPETLEELDLSDSSLAGEHVQHFLEHRETYGGLKRLVLEGTLITEAEAGALAALGPEIRHSRGGGARYRYLVGME